MWNSDKIKRLFTFDKIVGYMTIAGSIATVIGATIINNFTVELKPVIEVMQEEGNLPAKSVIKVVRDTVMLVQKDTVTLVKTEIKKDTVYVRVTESSNPQEREKEQTRNSEDNFRKRHNLSH